ncbi:hypothetical protein LCGC14_2142550, partial [marine sediment metagenome]
MFTLFVYLATADINDDSIRSFWSFDGTLIASNTTAFTWTNNGVTSVPGIIQEAGQFLRDEGDDLTSTNSTNVGTIFSLNMWINPNSSATFQGLFAKFSGTGWELQFRGDTGNTAKIFYDVGGQGFFTSKGFGPDQWHMLTFVKNGTNETFFINGSQDSSTIEASAWATNGVNYQMGSTVGGANYNGLIDMVLFTDRALTGQEINLLYNNGLGLNFPFEIVPPTFSTVVNNATATTTTGDVVNWTTTITDIDELSFCWFTHNDTGTFTNETVQACTTPFIFDQEVIITAGIGDLVCGFFTANNTANQVAQTSDSCFTVVEITPPQFVDAANNASTAVINDVVQFTINISDNFALGSWTFGSNGTGSFANISLTFFNGETAVNLSVNQTVPDTPFKFVCGRFYFNDTSGNENSSESCFTTSNLFRNNITAFNARTNDTIVNFTAFITGITDPGFFTSSTTTTGLIRISLAAGNYSVITNATAFTNGTGFINVTAPTNASFSMFPDPSSISLTILREGNGSVITQRVDVEVLGPTVDTEFNT